MQLLQPKETRNIRFDFRTDDLEFHTSEEEYEEELSEELKEEEEIYEEYDGEEEYDSEAGDSVSATLINLRGKTVSKLKLQLLHWIGNKFIYLYIRSHCLAVKGASSYFTLGDDIRIHIMVWVKL